MSIIYYSILESKKLWFVSFRLSPFRESFGERPQPCKRLFCRMIASFVTVFLQWQLVWLHICRQTSFPVILTEPSKKGSWWSCFFPSFSHYAPVARFSDQNVHHIFGVQRQRFPYSPYIISWRTYVMLGARSWNSLRLIIITDYWLGHFGILLSLHMLDVYDQQ